jgi:hypothetical protein
MANRRLTNDEHMDRLERYLTLLLQGGRQEKRRLKRQREIDEKFAILRERQKRWEEQRPSSENDEKS